MRDSALSKQSYHSDLISSVSQWIPALLSCLCGSLQSWAQHQKIAISEEKEELMAGSKSLSMIVYYEPMIRWIATIICLLKESWPHIFLHNNFGGWPHDIIICYIRGKGDCCMLSPPRITTSWFLDLTRTGKIFCCQTMAISNSTSSAAMHQSQTAKLRL